MVSLGRCSTTSATIKPHVYIRGNPAPAKLPVLHSGRVEEGRGVAYALRFPSPLIKLDVPISGIQLSDWLHLAPVGVAPM
jgi:hypothetical protein